MSDIDLAAADHLLTTTKQVRQRLDLTRPVPRELLLDCIDIASHAPDVWDPDANPAELYYLPDDFAQAHDLAAENPQQVRELKDLFWREAERYKVLPLLATLSAFFGITRL